MPLTFLSTEIPNTFTHNVLLVSGIPERCTSRNTHLNSAFRQFDNSLINPKDIKRDIVMISVIRKCSGIPVWDLSNGVPNQE
jgi:hypothetical protein